MKLLSCRSLNDDMKTREGGDSLNIILLSKRLLCPRANIQLQD